MIMIMTVLDLMYVNMVEQNRPRAGSSEGESVAEVYVNIWSDISDENLMIVVVMACNFVCIV
jgi:hypothetical protein